MANTLLYYLIVINVVTFLVYGEVQIWPSTDSIGTDCTYLPYFLRLHGSYHIM